MVIEARELLQEIANERYWAAVKVQGQYRRLLALREAERRRRAREREIAEIFGELGLSPLSGKSAAGAGALAWKSGT